MGDLTKTERKAVEDLQEACDEIHRNTPAWWTTNRNPPTLEACIRRLLLALDKAEDAARTFRRVLTEEP